MRNNQKWEERKKLYTYNDVTELILQNGTNNQRAEKKFFLEQSPNKSDPPDVSTLNLLKMWITKTDS